MGGCVRLLITTRNEDTASALGPHRLVLGRLNDELALRMLEDYSGTSAGGRSWRSFSWAA
jgi:hypothetical protein